MIKSLRDILVVCDMDNTLLAEKNELQACNQATINLLCALGGRFTVASVRSPESIKAALKNVRCSCPVIACGGSLLFDMEDNEAISLRTLNQESAIEAVQDVIHKFPDVGVEIMSTEGKVYVVQSNQNTTNHLKDETLSCVLCPVEQVPTPWFKVVFTAQPVVLRKVQEFTASKVYADIYFMPTNFSCLEIMPQGVNKAYALKELCKKELIPLENTIVIGGHFSDIELMKVAGYAVAVGNAPQEVKVVADKIVSNCADGGAGEYIYSLIKRYT